MNILISVGELIDRSWDLYRKNFKIFMHISGWLLIVAILDIVALTLYPSSGALTYHANLTTPETIGVIIFAFTKLILSPLLGFWVFLAIVHASNFVISQKLIDFKNVYQATKNRYWQTLWVVVMVGFVLLFAQVITLGPSVLLGILGSWINNVPLLVIANLLFLIGLFVSIYFTTRWTILLIMAPYTAALDNKNKKDALVSSRKLIAGRFWQVVLRIILPKIIFILFGLFAATILSLLVQIFVNSSTGIQIDQQIRMQNITESIIPILITILLNPLIILSDVLLFKNLTASRSTSTQ